MKIATVKLTGDSPYSPSRRYDAEVPKLERESHDAYDERNWREHLHYDRKTEEVYIPPMALKNALVGAAKLFSERIVGKGPKTWTKHFLAGVLLNEPVMLGIQKMDVASVAVYCDAQGKKGSSGGAQVLKRFPIIPEWSAEAKFYILDDTITKEIFEKYMVDSGMFVGIGRWRPENGGLNGRILIGDISWSER